MAARVLTFKHPDQEPVVIEVDKGFTIFQVFAISLAAATFAVIVVLTLYAT